MGDKTAIAWTDATWNPIIGCSHASAGCVHCYAETMAARLERMGQERYADLTRDGRWTGETRLVESALDQPLRWRRPRMVLVCSMADLFHESVPDEWIAAVFGVMAKAHWHTFQVLTKRPERAARVLARLAAPVADCSRWVWAEARRWEWPGWYGGDGGYSRWPLPNVWLGTTVENQAAADERIPHLLAAPAAVRWLSMEPLLEAVNILGWARSLIGDGSRPHLPDGTFRRLDWVVVGGESGPRARPMHPDWARDIRDQCQAAGVPYFFKQWGEWAPYVDQRKYTHGGAETPERAQTWLSKDGQEGACWIVDDDGTWSNWTGDPPDDAPVAILNRAGKHAAGRQLDGREWDEMPEPTP